MKKKISSNKIVTPPKNKIIPSKNVSFFMSFLESTKNIFFSSDIKMVRIRWGVGIIFVGTILSCIFHWYIMPMVGLDRHPYNTFFHVTQNDPHVKFWDFYVTYDCIKSMNPYQTNALCVYFPMAFHIMRLFLFFTPDVALYIFLISTTLFLLWYLYTHIPVNNKLIKILLAVIICFMSYPVLAMYRAANQEAWVFMAISLFAFFYKKHQYFWSMIFLCFAIDMKFFPAIFAIMYLTNKQYKYFFLTAVICLVSTWIGYVVLKSNIEDSITAHLEYFRIHKTLAMGSAGMASYYYSSGVFMLVRFFYYYIFANHTGFPDQYEVLINNTHTILSLLIIGIVITVFFIYKVSFWQKICLLTLIYVGLPHHVHDYRLMQFLIPFILLLANDKAMKYDIYYIIALAFILIPKDYYIFHEDGVSSNGIISPLFMLFLIILLIKEIVNSKQYSEFITDIIHKKITKKLFQK